MNAPNWEPSKPFDLRARLFEFALLMIRVAQFLHTRGVVASELSAQVLRAGTSAGANYEEADDGSSPAEEHEPVIRESQELVRIVASIIRNAEGR